MPAFLDVHLMGPLRLEWAGEELSARIQGRTLSLLLYLLLHPATPIPRDYLAFQLWPDSSEPQALSNLRTQLSRLSKALPTHAPFFQADRQTILWLPDAPCSVDYHRFLQGCAQATDRVQLDRALDQYQGPLLPGRTEPWLTPFQAQLKQTTLELLARGLQLSQAAGDRTAAAGYLHRSLEVDPLHEEHYVALIQLYLSQGSLASAQSVFRTCRSVLREALGVEPGPVLQQLYLTQLQRDAGRSLCLEGPIPLLERDREWEQLLRLWQLARGGRTQAAAILGGLGMGKTRLMLELLGAARRDGAPWAMASCRARGHALAYEAVSELLRSLPRSRFPELALKDVAMLLPELEAHGPGQRTEREETSFEQRHRLFSALTRIVQALQPLVLAIDDVQWCDIESLDWVMHLLTTQPALRLLVILGMRSDEPALAGYQGTVLRKLQVQGQLLLLPLKPLRPQAAGLLAAQVLGAPLSPEGLTSLQAETGGIPLFLVEILRARSSGDLKPGQRLPHSLRAVIEARLSRLAPQTLATLEAAAVLGHHFDERLLVATSGLSEDQVLDALDELWNRAIFRQEDVLSYGFSHGQLAELAYEQLSPPRRRLLHLNAARALDTLPPAQRSKRLAELARHCERGGLEARAWECALEAGEHAEGVAALREALTHYEMAWRLDNPGLEATRRWHLLTRLEAVRSALWNTQGADEAVSAMVTLAETQGNEDWLARATLARLRLMINAERPGGVHALALRLLEQAQRAGMPAYALEARFFVAQGGMFGGTLDAEGALAQLEAAEALIETLGEPALLLRVLCHRVLVHFLERDPEALNRVTAAALARIEAPGELRYRTWLLHVQSTQAANLCLEGALELAQASLALCRKTELQSRIAAANWVLGNAFLANRRFQEARDTLQGVLASEDAFFGTNSRVQFSLTLIRALLGLGQSGQALAACQALERLPLEDCELDVRMEAGLLVSDVLTATGQAAQALIKAQAQLAALSPYQLSPRRRAFLRLEGLGVLARAQRGEGKLEGALATLCQAREEANAFDLLRFRPMQEVEFSAMLLEVGRAGEALAVVEPVFRRLEASAEGLTRPPEVCLVYGLALGELGRREEARRVIGQGWAWVQAGLEGLEESGREAFMAREDNRRLKALQVDPLFKV